MACHSAVRIFPARPTTCGKPAACCWLCCCRITRSLSTTVFFLPELVRDIDAFIAYDLLKFILLPGVMLWFLHRRLQLGFNELCLIGRGSAYNGGELAVLTFWWAGFFMWCFCSANR